MGILFIRQCVLCGTTLSAADGNKAMLCANCAAEVRQKYRYTDAICLPGTDGAASALRYTGAVRNAIRRFKFHSQPQYADWFAAQMLPLLAEHLDIWNPDLITFMPIGFLRLHKRGYNQAELLAKAVAKPFGLPCQATLRKRLFVPKQSSQKDAAARLRNAKRALSPLANVDLHGKSVVLVDDVITTGAMATEAAKLLRKMGAASVYVLAAAHTVKD